MLRYALPIFRKQVKQEEGDMARGARKGVLPPVLSAGLLAYSLSPSLAADKKLPCGQQTAPNVNCTCDLKSLRPLQGAIGMGEVQEKAEKIKAKPEKEKQKLEADPIKIVRGPDGSRSRWTTVRNRSSSRRPSLVAGRVSERYLQL